MPSREEMLERGLWGTMLDAFTPSKWHREESMTKNVGRNKHRGSTYERKLVNLAKDRELTAKRAYASNGEALGEVKEVDLMIEGYRVQAKKRVKLPAYLAIDEGVDMVVFSRDHGPDLVLVDYHTVLNWIKVEGIYNNLPKEIKQEIWKDESNS